ncbi:DNA internalization-related competence protein ComEC/Rec2 [Robertmurraya kyonggiensis]|uniref:DNA internalization-related competence protein ComEC/Rec2 n=1 Tax=Robertmurraya kyonggiensis TaxID=1037680 RepID=UPI00130D596E|nr:DNA internalization-related competence protein ComEC/Rec2 [Robertmurraya kyonggiensis]
MKGNWIFICLAALLGVLFALEGKWIFLGLAILLFLFLRLVRKFSAKMMLITVFIFILFLGRTELTERLEQTLFTGEEKAFFILFEEPPKIDGNYFTTYGKDEGTKETFVLQYRLSTIEEKEAFEQISVGTVCKVKGNLAQPEPSRNPNAFDYKEYLRHEHISWILEVENINLNQCEEKRNLLAYLQKIRQNGIQYIYAHFPQNTAPFAAALIFGDRNLIEPDLMTAYQRLGIVHLIALSGLNVAMLIGILFYTGLRLHITREKMVYALMAFLPIYIILTGGAPSVIRACLMMLFALVLTKFSRKKLMPVDILSIVFVGYVFIDPHIIYNVGFQLSFVVTYALILSASILEKYVLKPVPFLIATSIISQIASMPILLYHFFEFSIVSFLVNLVYVPLFSVVITPVLMIMYFLHLLIGDLLNPLLHFFDFNLRLIHQLTLYLSKFPLNTLVLGRPSNFVLILYCVGIPYFFFRWEKARTIKQIVVAVIIPISLLTLHLLTIKLDVSGEVMIIDVGQGDSILIQLPMNKGTYLIDTGGTLQFSTEEWMERADPFEVGKDVVVPYLKSKGITKLDKLILTHGDMDHVGGAKAVLQSLKVEEVVLPKVEEPSELEIEILELCDEKKIPIHFAIRGDTWTAGGYRFAVLSPSNTVHVEKNDQSIVLYAEIAKLKWLFTGDLEEEGERKLLANYPKLKVDVLKVGHHGSKTSTTESLLDQLEPKVALISARENNRFGHPHGDVLARLEERNIRVYRTDENGAITFQFRGEQGTFLTHFHMIKRNPN